MELLEQLTEIIGSIDNLLKEVGLFSGILILAFGIMQCFFGFRIARMLEGIVGFLIFGNLGMFLGRLGNAGEYTWLWGIICAFIGAFLAYKFFKFGIFLICAMLGLIIGGLSGGIQNLISGDYTINIVLGILFALITGVLGLIYTKAVIIISTGFSGGSTIGSGLALVGLGLGGFAIGIVCVILGWVVQFHTHRAVPMSAASPTANKYVPMTAPSTFSSRSAPMSAPSPTRNGDNMRSSDIAKPVNGKYCTKCGHLCDENAIFCATCGTSSQQQGAKKATDEAAVETTATTEVTAESTTETGKEEN